MSIKSKRKVDTFVHEKSGVSVDCYIEGTRFTAMVLGDRVEADTAEQVKRTIMDRLQHWMQVEWFPVILVHIDNGDSFSYRRDPEGSGLKCKVRRSYITRTPCGSLFECDWDVPEEHRKATMYSYNGGKAMKLSKLPLGSPIPFSKSDSDIQEILMDYDEAMWQSLGSIIIAIDALRNRLSGLLRTKEGVNQLAASGAKLLVAPQS